MSYWEIVVPETTTNLVTNPSVEDATTGYTVGAGALARSSSITKFGAYSIQWTPGAAAYDGFYWSITLATTTTYTFSCWFFGETGVPYRIYGYDTIAPGVLGTAAEFTGTDTWERQEVTFTTGANAACRLYVSKNNSADVNVCLSDAWQCEAKAYSTTYCDGDQPGCEWVGERHNSTSLRSAQSRAGGRIYDLQTSYSFKVERMIDVGQAPITQHLDEYALIPGGEVQGYKMHPRVFALDGFIQSATSLNDLHDKVQALLSLLKPDRHPGNQPVILRYNNATVEKEISAYFEGGMEGRYNANMPYQVRLQLRFLAADPLWYEIGESAAALDTNDSATLRYLGARLRTTGQWDDLGLTANPTANGSIFAVCYATDGYVYFGGTFTGFDGNAGWDYLVGYNRSTGAFERIGGASDFNGTVSDIIEGPDGTIYACGTFTNCAAVANADYIAQWSGAAWTAVGQPVQGAAAITQATAMAWDRNGLLLIGGNFTDWANVAAADYFVTWDGTSYAAVGAGGTGPVNAVAVDSANNYYIGGGFLNWSADANADRMAWWNGTAWAALNATTFGTWVYTLYVDESDVLYIGGNFADIGDANGDYIVSYNGTNFESLGTGLNNICYKIAPLPDGTILAMGDFTSAGGLTLTDRIARWTGSSWVHVDLNMPGAPSVEDMASSPVDPVVPSNYDIYIGFTTTGAANFSGDTAVTNAGTATAYPRIQINRSGGTTATLTTIRNETTGKELLFDYSLLDGETLTIYLEPTGKRVHSRFYGNRPDAILPTSDFGTFALQPGANTISVFVDVSGGPTITANIIWRDGYWGID